MDYYNILVDICNIVQVF